MKRGVTTRAALGRETVIGDLYDVRTDNLCGISIFKTSVPEKAVEVEDADFMDVHVVSGDTFAEKFSKMDVTPELQVSLLGNLFPLKGSGRYFRDQKESARTVKSSLLYKIQTKDENVNIYHEDLKDAFTTDTFENGMATHVVTGISWGATTVLSCSYDNKEDLDAKEIEATLSTQLKKISLSIKEGGPLDFNDGENWNGIQFDIRIYGDILPKNEKLPITFASALVLMKQVPSLVPTYNKGKGKPLMFHLTPISILQSYLNVSMKANTMMRTLDKASLIRVVQLFDEMANAQQELNDFHQDALDYKFCVKDEHMQTIAKIKKQTTTELASFRSKLSSLIIQVRSGKRNVPDLDELIKQLQSSSVAPQKTKEVLRSLGSLNEKISFAKTLIQRGAQYIGLGSSFNDEILNDNDSKAFVFFFTQNSKSQNPSSWTENCQIFFQHLGKNKYGCKYFALDCDIHQALQPKNTTSCVQLYQGGHVICKDLLYQKMTSAVPFAQSVFGTEKTTQKPKPTNRIPLYTPCTGNDCDSTTSYEWTCKICEEIIEYGFDNNVYCHCGATLAIYLEFKCTDSKHGVAFERHSEKYFAELISQFKEINILILGETGVGKSTWINGFANFLTYQSLQEAEDGELITLIPSKFIAFDAHFEENTVTTGTDQNEIQQTGHSATQEARVYPFLIGRTLVRLIDTPGVGDTRGIEQDKKNFQNMLATLSHFQEIHGICILLKPNNSRINVMFRFCIKELLTYLHRDASKNIMFCFTNSRGTFYRPGDTMPALKALLKENKEVKIVVSPDTVYCYDSEAYRFLAAVKNNPPVRFSTDERENFGKSWTNSIAETMRMLQYIRGISPHPIQNTLNLNHARDLVLKLTRPLAEISRNIQTNKAVMEDEKNAIQKTKEDIKELEKMQWTDRIEIEVIKLDYPKTVCSNSACVNIWKVGINDVMTTEYVQVCHDHCSLKGVQQDTIGDPGLMNCWAMNKTSRCRNSTCKHHYREHLHVYYDSIQVVRQAENKSVTESLKKNLNAAEMKRKMIEEKNALIEEYEAERKEVERASVKFAYFLKTNAITPYNDDMEKYLDHLIREEEDKVMCGGNESTLNYLKINKESYMYEKSGLEKAMQKGEGAIPTVEEIVELVSTLKKLKHSGQSLEDALDCINYAGKNALIETTVVNPSSKTNVGSNGCKGEQEKKTTWGFKSTIDYLKGLYSGGRDDSS